MKIIYGKRMGDAFEVVLIGVAVCLTVLVTVFLLARLGRNWIQRAPTDKAAKRRRTLFWVYLLVPVVIWEYREAIAESKLWRHVSGTCSIVLLNKSGGEVTNLDLVSQAIGDPEARTNRIEPIANNGRWWTKTRADEFKVERLTGTVGTNRFSFRGTAKKGERLVIAIEPGGRIAACTE